jgi:hypothetical protein
MRDLAAIVSDLLADIEHSDPVDFGDMPADDDTTRRSVVHALVKFSEGLRLQSISAEAREALALATAARLVLDNLALNYRLLKSTGAPAVSVEQLLARLGVRKD